MIWQIQSWTSRLCDLSIQPTQQHPKMSNICLWLLYTQKPTIQNRTKTKIQQIIRSFQIRKKSLKVLKRYEENSTTLLVT